MGQAPKHVLSICLQGGHDGAQLDHRLGHVLVLGQLPVQWLQGDLLGDGPIIPKVPCCLLLHLVAEKIYALQSGQVTISEYTAKLVISVLSFQCDIGKDHDPLPQCKTKWSNSSHLCVIQIWHETNQFVVARLTLAMFYHNHS